MLGATPDDATSHPPRLASLPARLESALAGGPPVLPRDWPAGLAPLPGTALAVATSGSTGAPKWVCLSAAALRVSAAASAARLGGAGRWLAALPTRHIAGLNAVLRSLLAGWAPLELPPGRFTAAAFLAALAADDDTSTPPLPPPAFVSLVPTQLARLLAVPAAAGALARFEAVLVGGAQVPAGLLARARDLGARVVVTYGAAETAGGCVYDGVPLDGVSAGLDPSGAIELSGPVLALGYASPSQTAPAPAGFFDRAGRRWFRTSDLGEWGEGGRLVVIGRRDDVIVSGGVKVVPQRLEAVLRELAGVADAAATCLPDPEWGQAVVAVVVPQAGAGPDLAAARAAAAALGAAYAPKRLVTVSDLPYLAAGKLDRAALRALAAARLGAR